VRVLFDGADLTGPRTGVFWSTYHLLLHLAQLFANKPKGGSLQVLCYRRPYEIQPFPRELFDRLNLLQLEPVSFRLLPAPHRGRVGLPLAGVHYLVNMLAWAAVKGLGRLPARVPDGVDIYHCSDGLLIKGGRAKKVVTVHDLVPFLFPHFQTLDNRWYHKRKLRYVLHGADHIVAVSENTKRDLVRLFDVEPERVTVVHNGCDPIFRPCSQRVEMDAVRKSYGVEGRYLLSVSTLEPRKNLQRLLDCFLLLKKKPSYRDLNLVLVGASGWKSRRLEANLGELRGKGLVFLQQVPRKVLPHLFSEAEVFVYPSLYEGFGLPVLEAMACGCPVVASRSSAIPEVVGDAGLLFDPMSVEEMAGNIQMFLDDPGLRQKMARQGLDRAQLFSWEGAARKVIDLYRSLLEQ